MKLSTRLMLAMVALVLLTATAVGVLAYRNVEAIALPRALAGIEMNTRVVATGLEASVAGVRADVNTQGRAVQGLVRASLAGGRDPVDGTPEARWRNSLADRFIADLAAKPAYMQFSLIGIADGGREIVRVDRLGPDGNIRVAPEADLEPEADKDFFDAAIGLHAGEVYAAPVAPDRLRGAPGAPAGPLLRVAAPVFAANGKPFGLLNVYVDPRPAFDRLRTGGPRDRAIYVVTERGDFLLRADSEREFGSESSRPARIQDEFPQLAPALTASGWQARVMPDRAGAAFGVALMPVQLAEGPRLNVIQAVPRDRLVATPTAARNATFLAAVVAVLGALALAGLLARSLTRPLAQITAAVDNFTATTPIQVPTEASGEVGVLARSFARVAREMQEATAALKKETEERRHLFETSLDLILITDRRGNFVQVSPSSAAILGYKPEEMIGRSAAPFLHPDDLEPTRAEMRLARRSGYLRNFETRYCRKDGSIATLAWTGVWSEARQQYFFIGRDMTEATLAEEKFRLAVEASPSGIIMTDAGGTIILVNAETERMFGYLREELIGQSIDMFVPIKLRDGHIQERKGFVARPERRRMGAGRDLFGLRKDRSEFPVEIGLNPIHTPRGLLILSAVVDITESKRAQAALVESAAMARGIVETALDAFVQVDEAGAIVEWNSQAELMFGWSRHEAIGKLLVDMIVPELHRARYKEGLARFLRTGEGWILGTRFEIEAQRRDAQLINVEVSVTAFRRHGSHVFNWFIRDLTDRIAAEAQVRQAQKMEAVGQLTGGIAHDFNNILTVITGTIEIIAEAVANKPEAAAVAKMIEDAAERGADLTQRLLAFARKQPLQPHKINVNALVVDTAKLLRPTLGEHIEIESMLEEDIWPSLVDPHQLSTSLLNLALNARDAMPDGGKLTLETANVHLDENYVRAQSEVRPGPYVMVAVSDTGTGIPAAIRDRVFEPFFTTKEIGKGTGLGLSMVYGFVKQSGGHVKIYSEEGHGTTIKIYLPRARDVDEVPDDVAPIAPIEGGQETILVVEDDALVRAFVTSQLKSLGYATLVASNAAEAIKLIDQGAEVDLLFTDVIMPGGMNGRELAVEALKRRPRLKVLFTSGYTQDAIVHHGRLDPGVVLLAKPYRKSDLARMVRVAIGH
jgi:PAS domain S-box-containing protein